MEQLLAHLVGDYILQPNQIAQLKLTKWWAAAIHGVLYTLPFLLVTQSWLALSVICVTHVVIDRFRLAKYIGRMKNWSFKGDGYPEQTPDYMRVWLMIIVDNTIHLVINYISIKYL